MKRTDFVVLLDEIPPQGLKRHLEICDVEAAEFEFAVSLDAPLQADFSLARHKDKILVNGSIEGTLDLECSRCLGRFSSPVRSELETHLQLEEEPLDETEQELSPEDLETQTLKNGVIDLRVLIAEQVHLAAPVKPLCSEGCKGLCPRCGTDLNRRACSCSREDGSLHWDALKRLKVK